MQKTIGLIGTGNMGEAILKGIAKQNIVYVHDKDRKKVRTIRRKYKVIIEDLEGIIQRANILILAVKPQDFEGLLLKLKGKIGPEKIVVSIAAGITTSFIEKYLGQNVRIIRTMPNLPALMGEGITAISSGKKAKRADLLFIAKIFDHIGKTVIVEEKSLDAVTAISGSGPAYVFLFLEYLFKASKKIGLNDKLTRLLVLETFKGSITLLEKSKSTPEGLRSKVTSKGGTTEAAISAFTKSKTEKIFLAAIKAAKNQAKKLSK